MVLSISLSSGGQGTIFRTIAAFSSSLCGHRLHGQCDCPGQLSPPAGTSSQHCPGFIFDHLQNCPRLIYNEGPEVLNDNFEFKWV